MGRWLSFACCAQSCNTLIIASACKRIQWKLVCLLFRRNQVCGRNFRGVTCGAICIFWFFWVTCSFQTGCCCPRLLVYTTQHRISTIAGDDSFFQGISGKGLGDCTFISKNYSTCMYFKCSHTLFAGGYKSYLRFVIVWKWTLHWYRESSRNFPRSHSQWSFDMMSD